MKEILYPKAPINIYAEKLQPSAGFRKQAIKVIGAIFLFLITYLILLAASVVLAVLCCFAGYWLITEVPRFITIVIGLGLIVLGASVIFFMIKFIFAVSKDENDARVEITEEEQPRLFAFIRQLTFETNTQFPGKIFLSPDVNACVFYHSSFWSMFLPIRKNLEIGLGLVNSINISEFKAVMAHEFGHFSQRSMKLGSFTYNANKIIHNMLYDNNSYVSFIQGWANIHGYLAILGLMTFKIAAGIQWILRGTYKLINVSYMALSREMEFHADTIAASVAGGNNLVTSLSRIEIANGCFSTSISSANERLKEKKVARNIFLNQLTVFRSIADKHGLSLKQGLPHITYQFVSSFSSSRVNFKNQWASHPSLEERKQHLDNVAMDAVPDETSAWAIFDNITTLQESLTAKLYRSIKLENDIALYDGEEFDTWYHERNETYNLPLVYKGFYDDRYPEILEWNMEIVKDTPSSVSHLEDLFSEENGGLFSSITRYSKDLEVVKAIKEKRIDVRSFDFDGKKYKREDCKEVIAVLEADVKAASEKLSLLDKEAFAFFYNKAGNGDVVMGKYLSFRNLHERTETYIELLKRINVIVQPFYTGTLSVDEIVAAVDILKQRVEPDYKKYLSSLISDGIISKNGDDDLMKRSEEFLNTDYAYFKDNAFLDEELNLFSALRLSILDQLHEVRFKSYKSMLVEQLSQYTPINNR
jgi:Zn-dependent protease with chaperone function